MTFGIDWMSNMLHHYTEEITTVASPTTTRKSTTAPTTGVPPTVTPGVTTAVTTVKRKSHQSRSSAVDGTRYSYFSKYIKC